MKKIIQVIFIIIIVIVIISPMIIYLNPFLWAIRREPSYYSKKTNNLISNLNKKHRLNLSLETFGIDTIWYFRDIKHKRKPKINFHLQIENSQNINTDELDKYLKEFNSKFIHKEYFDSIKVMKENKLISKISTE